MGPVVTGTGFVVEVVVEDRPPPVVLVGSVVVGWLGCVDVVVLEVVVLEVVVGRGGATSYREIHCENEAGTTGTAKSSGATPLVA